MEFLPGIGLVVLITLIAGFVAYIGDRVGHQVGRRRLTLFGLRPKYTSTIVAVATGMLIALAVTLAALITSQYVRTAFFHLGTLNAQINALQAQAAALQKDVDLTRNKQLVLPAGQPIAGVSLILDRDQTDAEQRELITRFFDESVRLGNEYAKRVGLKTFRETSSDGVVKEKLQQELSLVRDLGVRSPVMIMCVADQNLFRGEQLHFAIAHWRDERLATRGEVLASADVTGGQPYNLNLLMIAALETMAKREMPAAFLRFPYVNQTQGQILAELSRLRGKYRIVAKAGDDIYPHTGGVALEFSLSPARK